MRLAELETNETHYKSVRPGEKQGFVVPQTVNYNNVPVPPGVAEDAVARVNPVVGRVAFLDPGTFKITHVVKVTRLEVGRDFRTHARFGVGMLDDGSVAHPNDVRLKIFASAADAGTTGVKTGAVVFIESDPVWVRVTGAGGQLVAERRWASLLNAAVPAPDETAPMVPEGTAATRTFPVGTDGRLNTRGRPLVGGPYARKQVAALDHDNGKATLYDPNSRVILAVVAGTALDPPPVVTRTEYRHGAGLGEYFVLIKRDRVKVDHASLLMSEHHRAGTDRVNLSVGDDGWFVLTHPKTGALITSGWTADASAAPVTGWEVGDERRAQVDADETHYQPRTELKANVWRWIPPHFFINVPSGLAKGAVARVNSVVGRVAFLHPETFKITHVVKVAAVEVGRDFRTHARFGVGMLDDGSVAHPNDVRLKIFASAADAGTTGVKTGAVVFIESDPVWVRVTGAGGQLVAERRWASLLNAAVPAPDETAPMVPEGTAATRTFPVGTDGRLDTRGRPLVGGPYAGKQVAALDHDNGKATLYDPNSRVILAVVAGTALDGSAPAAVRTPYRRGAGQGQYANPISNDGLLAVDGVRFAVPERHRRGKYKTKKAYIDVDRDGRFRVTNPKSGETIRLGWVQDASEASPVAGWEKGERRSETVEPNETQNKSVRPGTKRWFGSIQAGSYSLKVPADPPEGLVARVNPVVGRVALLNPQANFEIVWVRKVARLDPVDGGGAAADGATSTDGPAAIGVDAAGSVDDGAPGSSGGLTAGGAVASASASGWGRGPDGVFVVDGVWRVGLPGGLERGSGRGEGNLCLLDSLAQLMTGHGRPTDRDALRVFLLANLPERSVERGRLVRGETLDVYDQDVSDLLMRTVGFRLQVFEIGADGRVRVHPAGGDGVRSCIWGIRVIISTRCSRWPPPTRRMVGAGPVGSLMLA